MNDTYRNLGDILGKRRRSGEPAIVEIDTAGNERMWRCAEVEQGTLAFTGLLQSRGVEPGTPVGIFAANSVAYLLAYMGIMRAGCVCVPVNTRQPGDVVEFICRDARIEIAFADSSAEGLLPSTVDTIAIDKLPDGTGQDVVVDSASTALILYTSGSTGRPKGVVLSHRSQLSMVDAIIGGTDATLFAGQRGIVVAPLFHMNALVFIASFLSGGGSIVLMSKFDAEAFIGAINGHGVTVITGVPTMIAILHDVWQRIGRPGLPGVTTVYIGSAPVTEAIVEQSKEMMPQASVLNSYGTTETGGGLFGPHPGGIERPPLSVGHAMPHVDLKLDEKGALQVRAPSAMTGYLNLPEVTAARFQNGWFDTGDLFEVDENGFYYFVGRADDMFVCSGENIYPGEVEKAIESHQDVIQASVVPVADAIRGQMPVAFVVASNANLSEVAVQQHVKDNAARYLYPRRVWFLDALPLASTTKVDRRGLMEDAARRVATEQEAAS